MKNKKFSHYLVLRMLIFALVVASLSFSSSGEEFKWICPLNGKPCMGSFEVDITNNKDTSCTDKVKWEIQKNCEGSYKEISSTCVEGNNEITIESGKTKTVKCSSNEIFPSFTGKHCVKVSFCGATENFYYGDKCGKFTNCKDCIGYGFNCDWCKSALGTERCVFQCSTGLQGNCAFGECIKEYGRCTITTSTTTTTTTTTTSTTISDTTKIQCKDSYPRCDGYCDNNKICEEIKEKCECVEYKTACDEFKEVGKLPERFDWRNWKGKNVMTKVKSQGRCRSCWVFSTIGAIEATYKIENWNSNLEPDLSEQYLLSCSGVGNCWLGGIGMGTEMGYVKGSGISDEDCFPYVAKDITCQKRCSDWNKRLWKIRGYGGGIFFDRNKVKETLICKGPLSVFSNNWGHYIVLAGYDDDSPLCRDKYGEPGCWIIKNSWGVKTGWLKSVWHEGGYGYVPYEGHKYSDLANYGLSVEGVSPPE